MNDFKVKDVEVYSEQDQRLTVCFAFLVGGFLRKKKVKVIGGFTGGVFEQLYISSNDCCVYQYEYSPRGIHLGKTYQKETFESQGDCTNEVVAFATKTVKELAVNHG